MADSHIPDELAAFPALADASDEELVRLLERGQKDAMSVLFYRHYAIMLRVAVRIVRDRAEAEDIVQVAFLDFYRNLKLFDSGRGNLRAWLLQYVYGRGINRVNAMKVRQHSSHVELSDISPTELSAPDNGVMNLNGSETKQLVQEMLETLQDKKRKVVELICFEGLTIPEVATLTQESSNKVHHDYYRALRQMRAWVNNREGTPPKPEKHEPVSEKVTRRLAGTMKVDAEEVEIG